MDRRGFLRLFGAVAGAAAVVPQVVAEELVGKMVAAAPEVLGETVTAATVEACWLDEINELTRKHILPEIVDSFFRTSSIMRYLQQDRGRLQRDWFRFTSTGECPTAEELIERRFGRAHDEVLAEDYEREFGEWR